MKRTLVCLLVLAGVGAAAWGVQRLRSRGSSPGERSLLGSSTIEAPVRAALDAVAAAVERDPGNAGLRARQGMTFQAHGLYAEAKIAYSKACELAPGEVKWARLLGITCLLLSLPREAEAAFTKAIAIDSNDLVSKCSLALLWSERGDDEGARKLYREVVEAAPDYIAARVGLGQLALRAGALEPARKSLEMALEVDPRCGAAHAALATLCAREGKTSEAELHQRWSRATPGKLPLPDPLMDEVSALGVSSAARWKRGKDAGAAGDWKKAVAELREAVRLRPDWGDARYYLALSLTRSGAEDEGLQELEAASRLEGRKADALLQIARIHLARGKKDEALKAIAEAREAAPLDAEAHILLGKVFASENQRDRALESFEKAVEVQPSSAAAQLALGHALLPPGASRDIAAQDGIVRAREVDRARKALQAFERVLELDADTFEAYDGSGMAHLQIAELSSGDEARNHELSEALVRFSQAAKYFPKEKQGYVHWIQALRLAKQPKECLEAIRRAHAKWPDDPRFTAKE